MVDPTLKRALAAIAAARADVAAHRAETARAIADTRVEIAAARADIARLSADLRSDTVCHAIDLCRADTARWFRKLIRKLRAASAAHPQALRRVERRRAGAARRPS